MSNKYKIFVIADVHGFYTEMMRALIANGFDINNPNHLIYSLGDEFDRGQEAVKMFEFLSNMDRQGRLRLIRGNHTDLLFDCLDEIKKHNTIINTAHIHNKTLDTIGQFLPRKYKYIIGCLIFLQTITNKEVEIIEQFTKPLVKLLDKGADYTLFRNYAFVHGWFPDDDTSKESCRKARWKNGMEEWAKGNRKDGYTVFCGHYHCSWGWSNLRNIGEEFPDFTVSNWQKYFEPFEDDGIVALDACTSYSGIVNVKVLDIDVEDD